MNTFDKIRKKLSGRGLDAMLVTSEANRKYATGFHSSAGMALITKEGAYFYIDSRYIEAAQKNISDAVVEMTDINTSYNDKVNAVIEKYGIKSLGVEDGVLSYAEYNQLQAKLKATLVPAQDLLTELRLSKSKVEVEKLTAAQRIAEKALDEVLGIIKAGMTEKQIAAELIYRMLRNGAEGIAFDPIVVSGVRSSMPHGVPADVEIKKGDFVTLDFGCKLDGYCSDMTRTVAIGCVTDEMSLVYNTVLKAQEAGISIAKAGLTGAEVDAAAREVITKAGYGEYFGHGFGHGLGLDVHEAPTAGLSGKTPMPAGAVISAEPGIYLPGSFGVRIEDVIVLEEKGCKNLMKAPKDLIIL
jgi:Xaa-Pro aminopeptidase